MDDNLLGKVGYELPLHNEGRDVLLEVLSDPTKQGRFNRNHILDQQAEEKPLRYGSYLDMPSIRGHRY